MPELPGWHCVAALVLGCLLVTPVLPFIFDRHPGGRFLDQWLVAYGSWYATLPAALLTLLPGRWGRCAFASLCVGLTLGLAWHIASVTLYADQVRTLVWEELWFRLTDRMSHPFLFEAVSRPSGLLFLGGFPALVALMSWSFFRYARARACHVAFAAWILAVGSVVTLVGSGIAGNTSYLVHVQMPLGAPWVTYRLSTGLPFDPTRAEDGADGIAAAALERSGHWAEPYLIDGPDEQAARRSRQALHDPDLAPGPDPVLAGLAGRYPGRGIIAIFLESHRLSDVDGVGTGAHGHQPASPHLAAALAQACGSRTSCRPDPARSTTT